LDIWCTGVWSSTITHPFGLSNVDLSEPTEGGVDVVLDKAATLTCAALSGTVVVGTSPDILRIGPNGIGLDTFLLGTLVPSLSSVALSLACNSCNNLNPLDLAVVALTIRADEGAGRRDFESERTMRGEGDDGKAEAARLRVVLERDKDGNPDGEWGRRVLNRLFGAGELSDGIYDMVEDFGIDKCSFGCSVRSEGGCSSSEAISTLGRSDMGSCAGDKGTEIEEGGVGRARDRFSRRMAISLLASAVSYRTSFVKRTWAYL
jgi:hypothetical protein